MNAEKITFDASVGSGNKIAAFICPATSAPVKGVFQICHGMADYFGRYEELVDHLNKEGWHVCGMDMLGHGATYGLNEDKDMLQDMLLLAMKDATNQIDKEVESSLGMYGNMLGGLM